MSDKVYSWFAELLLFYDLNKMFLWKTDVHRGKKVKILQNILVSHFVPPHPR